MRFEILGPVAVVRDDEDLTPRGRQQRRLLAALVMASPEPIGAEALADALWGADPPSANALQAQISKLRRVVAPVTIRAVGSGYALDVEPHQVDRTLFEDELDRATALLGDDPVAATALFETARARVRGEPLVDLVDAEVARAERARLELSIQALDDRRLDALLASGRLPEALAVVESLLAARPLDEHLWAQRMRTEYRLGRQADALRSFQRARRALAEQLGVEPGPELAATERQVLVHDPAIGEPPSRTQVADAAPRRDPLDLPIGRPLPARLSSFVGRSDVLGAVRDALATDRLVTLVGPGGVGKTTTALEAVRDSASVRAQLVELAPLSVDDAPAVVQTVLEAVGTVDPEAITGREEVEALGRIADGIGDLSVVLVFDNCEHVIGATAKVAHALLEACPNLRIVATSREPLGVPGEHVLPVPPLPVADGIELFLERARSAGSEVVADDGRDAARSELPAISELVERLDGLPLAIELAAARTRSLTAGEIVERLDDRFRLLSSGPRTVDQRQRTLLDVVEWSHALLEEPERRVFRRLAAFAGGASPAAVAAVCADDELSSHDVPGVLGRLVDKSLVVVERRSGGVRYRLLETIGAFAAEQLRASGELERVLDLHAELVADQVAGAVRGLIGADQRHWMEVLAIERENLRAALDVAVARSDAQTALRLVAPVGWWAYMTGQFEWGAALLEDALGCPGPSVPDDRAWALGLYGWLLANGPDMTTARGAVDQAKQLLAGVEDPFVEAVVLATWMIVVFFGGDLDAARDAADDAVAAARASGDDWATAIVDLVRGEILQADGSAEEAAAAFASAARGFERVGDDFTLSITLGETADGHEQVGDLDRAADALHEAVAVAERSGSAAHTVALRASLANLEILRGDLDRAEQLHHEVIAALDGQPYQWIRAISWNGLAMIERRRDDPDAADRWLDLAWRLRRTETVPHMRGLVLVARGYTADLRGDATSALSLQRAGLDVHVALGAPRAIAYSLEGVAGALAAGEDVPRHELAARLLGHADALRRSSGGPMPAAERFDVDRAEGRSRARLGDARFAELHAAGARVALDVLLDDLGALPPD